jgi:4-hydroxybenzoate polyprenyltransferase
MRSSISEPSGRSGVGLLGARLRLVHPFPSLLNGLAVGALALLAGAGLATAARLGVAMIALQFSIGALNDLRDAPRDLDRTPVKPLAAGLVTHRTAIVVVVAGAAAGLLLAAVSGPGALVVAALGLGCGYAYDLGLSRTAWSWAPLAVALPLVPVFAWLGVAGRVPTPVVSLVPVAILAGAGLAIGNAIADREVDVRRGVPSIALRMGHRLAWMTHAVALTGAVLASLGLLGAAAIGEGRGTGVIAAGLVIAAGAILVGSSASRRRPGWALEAIGVALLGVAWFAAVGR